MNYLVTFLYYLTWIMSILGYGHVILYIFKLFRIKNEQASLPFITILGFSGFIFVYLISSIINFFIPISFIISTTIQILGLIIFIINFKYFFSLFKSIDICSLAILFIYCYSISFRWIQYYDTGLYHFQMMKWIVYSKVPYGISNLYYAFGTNSAWFLISSVVEQPALLFKYSNFISNEILLFFYGLGISFAFKELAKKKITLANTFLALTCIPWLFNSIVSWSSSTSYDLPVGFYVYFIIFLFIYYFEGRERTENNKLLIFIMLVFSLFDFVIKISAVPILLVSLIIFILTLRKRETKIAFLGFGFSVMLFIPWLAKGIITSGYLLFPIEITKLSFLKWSTPLKIARASLENTKRIARGQFLDDKIVLNSFGWVSDWLRKFYTNNKIVIILIAVCVILFIIMLFLRNKNKVKLSALFYPLFLSCVSIAFWFFNTPDLRYGQGFVFSFLILLISYFIIRTRYNFKFISYLFVRDDCSHKKLYFTFSIIFIILGLSIFIFSTLYLNTEGFKIFLIKIVSLLKGNNIGEGTINKLTMLIYRFLILGLIILITGFIYLKNKKTLLIASVLFAFIFSFAVTKCYLFYQREYHLYNTSSFLPKVEMSEKITKEGNIIYVPVSGDQTWDSNLPATPFFYEDLKIIYEKSKPIVFYFENNG